MTNEGLSRPHFGARLYGPGSPETGAAVELSWRGEHWLVVRRGGTVLHTLRAADLQASARGFNNSQLALAWAGEEGEHTLVLDPAAATAFRDAAPAAIEQRFQPARAALRSTERRFRWGIAALVLVLSLPLVALGAFIAWADPLADWVVRRLPPGIEQQMGEAVLAQTRAQSRMVETGPAFDAVQAIGRRLARPGEALRFFLADRPEVNAFAAPGGVVVVFTGLLRTADSAEEVAGVLAHEIAHVELRHSLRQLVKVAGLKVLFSAALGDYGQLAGWGAQLTELKFSRDAEREADTRGLARLVETRIDPHGLPRFFMRLEKLEGAGGAVPTVLSTHPATRQRLEALSAAIYQAGTGAAEPIAVSWDAVRAALPAVGN
jgi:Zn-dependent protease with chaperone function